MTKVAFMTMDVETLFDTSCLEEKQTPYEKEIDAKNGFIGYLRLLDNYGVKATLFLTGDTLNLWQKEILSAKDSGHEIATHALKHENVTKADNESFSNSVKEMAKITKNAFGATPKGFRAPCFGIDENKIEILKGLGYTYDSSALNYDKAMRSGYLDLSAYEKLNDVVYKKEGFYEFKPCVGKVLFKTLPVSGGAYLRVLPWFIVKNAVKRYIKKSDAYLFYVHPFEVVNERIPKNDKLTVFEKLYLKRGRKSYLKKIESIIKMLKNEGYIFQTMEKYIANCPNTLDNGVK